jgi:putative DNA primase/helicase
MADESGGGIEDSGEGLRVVVPFYSEPWLSSTWVLTHEAVVAEFKRLHGEGFIFLDELGEFYHWTGHVWERDRRRSVNRLMAELCRRIGAAQKKKTVRQKVEASSFITGCAGRVRDEVAQHVELFDRGEVLNIANATVKLNGVGWEARAQRRDDYCSKMAGVAAVPGPCPMWLAFLERITGGNAELVDYLQRVAGYCLTPFTTEQAFFFFYGSGGNGKGTFLRVLRGLLGDYATTASLDLFLASKFEQHPEELASLRGARLVVATETEAGRSWNESKIKALTGGDAVRARLMRQNSFEFDPQFKIVVSGNHQPVIKNTDPAMRRRLHLVPFEIEIPLSEQDGTLERRMLASEGPAIMAWALEGYNQWRQHGLSPPDQVVSATSEYFEEQDTLGQWVAECCDVREPDAFSLSAALFKSWCDWCTAAGERFGTQRTFTTRLKNARIAKVIHDHARTGNGFHGIRLKAVTYNDDPADCMV